MPQHRHSAFRRGLRDGAPFLVVVVPFAVLFGVLATEAGLNVLEALTFSIVVIAGAAQFTALQLMQEQAPTWVVLASALAVNLRMAMYSASVTPHLGAAPLWQRMLVGYFLVDQTYAQSMVEFETRPEMTLPEKLAYFFGIVVPVCIPWYFATVAGAWIGSAIPAGLGLDFVLPIAFLAMVGPMMRTRAHVGAALVAAVTALVCAGLPYNLGLMVGGIAGMMTGAQLELWQDRRRTPEDQA